MVAALKSEARGWFDDRQSPLFDYSEIIQKPISVTALQLWASYHNNEISADDKYKNKLVLLNGTVLSIQKDFTGAGYIELLSGRGFGDTVRAYLSNAGMQTAARFSRSQNLDIVCSGAGMVMGAPILHECDEPAQNILKLEKIVERIANDWLEGKGVHQLKSAEHELPDNMIGAALFSEYWVFSKLPANSPCVIDISSEKCTKANVFRAMKPDVRVEFVSACTKSASYFHLPPLPAKFLQKG